MDCCFYIPIIIFLCSLIVIIIAGYCFRDCQLRLKELEKQRKITKEIFALLNNVESFSISEEEVFNRIENIKRMLEQ